MAGHIQFRFELGGRSASGRHEHEVRRILIMADCMEEGERRGRLADRKILPIDLDNFDEVLARHSPRLTIPLGDTPEEAVTVGIAQLDDFHPDTLLRKLPVFAALREIRARLENPATFAAAAEELTRGMTDSLAPFRPAVGQTAAPAEETEAAAGSLFEHLLGKDAAASKPATAAPEDGVQRLIRHLVEPHLAKGVDPGEQRQWLSVIDDAIARMMRRILHHPGFQRLESVWRGIHWLMTRTEEGETLQVFLLDAPAAELGEDLAAAQGHAERTQLFRLLADSSIGIPGGEPWSLVLGAYVFGAEAESLDLLELLGAVSAGCGGTFLAAAHAHLLGCASLVATPDTSGWMPPAAELAERWQSLRLSPAARHIGLTLPRFMLRLPYGAKSDPTESFRFEEMPSRPLQDAYLWGNPVFACGSLIANTWVQGDGPAAGTMREIGDLPYHVVDDGGEKAMQPCAEVYLNEKTANAILDQGIMPLLSVRNSNRVLVPRLQSISRPTHDLG